MLEWGQGQVSWSLAHLPEVLLDGAVLEMHPEPSGRNQAVAVHRQSQDLWAGQAYNALVQGCGWAAGQNGAHLGLDAGGQAAPTSPGR